MELNSTQTVNGTMIVNPSFASKGAIAYMHSVGGDCAERLRHCVEVEVMKLEHSLI